jgi:methyl-accepting chemotaxis protein
MNAQIASSTKQQSAVAEDVNDHVHWITEVAESTSQNARQTAVAAEQLNELSNQLRGVVQRYRV